MDSLFVIPARGGSKGLPKKNIKDFLGKPLIHYSIDYARLFTTDENICLTTDDQSIIDCAGKIGLEVPFVRPNHLSTDTSDTFLVLKHALNYYSKERNKAYQRVILLQPTSPIREEKHLREALSLFNDKVDSVVSVCKSKSNPYFTLFEMDENGLLKICKGNNQFTSRQESPTVYELNGSIYVYNAASILAKSQMRDLKKVLKYEMDEFYSIDLDTIDDWNYAEYKCLNKK